MIQIVKYNRELRAMIQPFMNIDATNKHAFTFVHDGQFYLSLTYDKAYQIRVGDKFCCCNEKDLYDLDAELNKLGIKTKIARNCENNVLSIAIIYVPGGESND